MFLFWFFENYIKQNQRLNCTKLHLSFFLFKTKPKWKTEQYVSQKKMAKVRHNVCFPSLLFRSFFFVQLQCTFQDVEKRSLKGTSTFLLQKGTAKYVFQRYDKRFKTNPLWCKITNIHSSIALADTASFKRMNICIEWIFRILKKWIIFEWIFWI